MRDCYAWRPPAFRVLACPGPTVPVLASDCLSLSKMPAALRSSGLTADNMVASQDGYDPAAASPMPTTKPLLDKPTTPTSRTSLEKKMLQIVHQELQPVQAHIARLQEQLLLRVAAPSRQLRVAAPSRWLRVVAAFSRV